MLHTWKMAYMMQVRGRLWEYSETVKMFRPHLLRSSSSLDSSSSLSVLTPKREMLLLESEGPWETFLTPLICVINCCFCCFFFSRVLDVGDGISTSFCLSEGRRQWEICFYNGHYENDMAKSQTEPHTVQAWVLCVGCQRTQVHHRNTCSWLVPEGFIDSFIHHLSLHSFVHSCSLSSTCSLSLSSYCSFVSVPLPPSQRPLPSPSLSRWLTSHLLFFSLS